MIVECNNCGKKINRFPSDIKKSKSGFVYCSKSCSQSVNNMGNKRNFKDGLTAYRDIAYKEKEKICERCSYNEHTCILVVHHKDKNRENNTIENLEVLCPNCHAIRHIVNEKVNYVEG